MTQVVSIVPTLMWLQHRLGHSALGKEEAIPHPPSEKTIEFSPNRNLQQDTKVDTIATLSFADVEATGETTVGSSTLGRSMG